ncbi:MAG TPA: acetoin utilization protein AcuC [Chloroflexota bacterium]
MGGTTALVYHPRYDGRGFSPFPRAWTRYAVARQRFEEIGLFRAGVRCYEPPLASVDEVALVHDRTYVEFVRAASASGVGSLDGGDTKAWRGVFERALASVGGSLLGADLLARGEVTHVFNPGGGLHHARRSAAGGFCVFNDIAVAVRRLQRLGYRRVAVVDVDGHHGDGTQELLYDEPVLVVSLHRYGNGFYPKTGGIDEVGVGAGYGYTVNVPLPPRVGDVAYLEAFDAVVLPLLHHYRPEVLVFQCGVDGHYADPLVRLGLTTHAYQQIATRLHDVAHRWCGGRLLVVGGGGYVPENVARCWAVVLATIADVPLPDEMWVSLHDAETPRLDPSAPDQVREVVARLRALLFPIHGLSL